MRLDKVVRSGIAARYTFTLDDGLRCRAAFVRRPSKDIICLSSQIGCVGECKFCSAGDKPFVRDIRYFEMMDMVNLIDRGEKLRVHDTLVSFMGTGEPLANLDEVLRASGLFFGEGMKVAISTSGVKLHEQARRIPMWIKMQFTLISVDHNIRRALQPHVDSLDTLGWHAARHSGVKEFNVPLIVGVNDDFRSMEAIAAFSSSLGSIAVKLNEFHPMNGFVSSTRAAECLGMLKVLGERKGINCEYYETDGADIFAACGQFEVE